MFFIKGKGKKKKKIALQGRGGGGGEEAFDLYTYNVSLMYNMYI